MSAGLTRSEYDIDGTVQGVGFRPAIYRLATAAGLRGSVQNRSGTVRLVLEGEGQQIADFINALPTRLPTHARIESTRRIRSSSIDAAEASDAFRISASSMAEEAGPVIPADLGICDDCRHEIHDPSDRRYGYAFTTCTNCGPRYTVVNATPYDRERTTMAAFPLCARCRAEYENPSDRRFHAESIACPACGPKPALEQPNGTPVPGAPVRNARKALAEGKILAVRGIGGYLLAVDALSREPIRRLRERKTRPHKPFAVMARDVAVVRKYCNVGTDALALLASPEAPIVILDVPGDRRSALPLDLISPDTATLGVMLPTSPLHELLFQPLEGDGTKPFELLVMTSGNRGGEPVCIGNDEARTRLRDIADLLLTHDRQINLRNDDSLCALQGEAPQVWRRARGYAPLPIRLRTPLRTTVLAMGAELKNTIALGDDRFVVISPHVGDLGTPEALSTLQSVAECLPSFLDRAPQAVAVDLHPDMHSTRLGRKIAERADLPVVEVQHHHAHAVGCLAEHGLDTGLALVMDGTGLGTDGTIWGAELLDVTPDGYARLATFAPAPLPGGDAAVREPARQVVARWRHYGIDVQESWLARLGIRRDQADVWAQQCEQGINCPMSHAAGRLFDSFSALLGIAPGKTTYEGQSPIRLEAAARSCSSDDGRSLPFSAMEQDGLFTIDWSDAFRALSEPGVALAPENTWALAAHRAIAAAASAMVEFGLPRSPSRVVALSGGVFMNRLLNDLLVPALEGMGVAVKRHRCTPPNDGGISFGQAVVAGRR